MFTNLLTNAFEALGGRDRSQSAPRPGRSRAITPRELADADPDVIVQVADDGPGVPTEMVDRMFKPFFTTKAQGSGLGLAIVRKIVDAHDGRIDIRSAPGLGTRFTVTLPVLGGDEEPFGTTPRAAQQPE